MNRELEKIQSRRQRGRTAERAVEKVARSPRPSSGKRVEKNVVREKADLQARRKAREGLRRAGVR